MIRKRSVLLSFVLVLALGCAARSGPVETAPPAAAPAGTPGTPAPPPPPTVSIEGEPFRGSPDSPLVIVEFSDYQCPVCGRHMREVMPQLEANYLRTGKASYVYRDFPIEKFHPLAFKAAEAAHCAGDQGKFWEMHDLLLGSQSFLAPHHLPRHAAALGLDTAEFQSCLDEGRHAAGIREDLRDGTALQIMGTPSFYVGRRDPRNRVRIIVGKVIRGVGSYGTFSTALEQLLANPE